MRNRPEAPASTYRLQLNARFDLDAARELVPYLRELGVAWLYLSPVFAARQGSEHGYDVVDPNVVNPELGGREALDRLAAAVRDAGMGILLDIVPNHQAASTQNPRWVAMLRDGPASEAARWFDVDWRGGEAVAEGVLVWPLLGRDLDHELADGSLMLDAGPHGAPVLRYGAEVLPVVGAPTGSVREVLERQHYRLVQWRSGSALRNYRRFFDIGELAGVRVEDPAVLHDSHELVRALISSSTVHGLRVDHVDGLADPAGYLDALRAMAGEAAFVVVEKILGTDEALPADWPVDGTTGYEIADALTGVLVDPGGRARLEDALLRDNDGVRFPTVQRRAKREVLFGLFEAEWARVRRLLDEASLSPDALAALTVALDVYRTYFSDVRGTDDDRRRVEHAAAAAGEDATSDVVAVRAVASFITGDAANSAPSDARAELVRRWQQLTGAVMAKGHEDTALYRYPALLAQAEVGGDPGDDCAGALARFHTRAAAHRGLVTTSTHDTKRSEDVRARLAVVSERAEEFEAGLRRWRERVEPADGVTRVEQRFVAQTLLGAWPLDPDELESGAFAARMTAYLTKALREAKQHTSWLSPDEEHERAVNALVSRSTEQRGRPFRDAFGSLVDDVAFFGAVNALAQLTWKLALPGTVDVYRGTELWDLSLADPDNRRPVDFACRRALLARAAEANPAEWRSGAIKLRLTAAGLRARREDPELFVAGDYVPLPVEGERASHVLAFARRARDRWAVAVAPRLPASLTERGRFPVGEAVWGNTRVALPEDVHWRDVFTASGVSSSRLADILAALPTALLTGRR